MDQLRYIFLLALLAICCSMIWSLFRHFWPLHLGTMQDPNLESSVTSSSPPNTTESWLYAGARPKRTIAAPTPQEQSSKETTPKKSQYYMSLGTLVHIWAAAQVHRKIRKYSADWMMRLSHPSIKPKKPSQIDDLVSSFSSTLDSLPPQQHIQEWVLKITLNNYLTITFKWSQILKTTAFDQHPKSSTTKKISLFNLKK